MGEVEEKGKFVTRRAAMRTEPLPVPDVRAREENSDALDRRMPLWQATLRIRGRPRRDRPLSLQYVQKGHGWSLRLARPHSGGCAAMDRPPPRVLPLLADRHAGFLPRLRHTALSQL